MAEVYLLESPTGKRYVGRVKTTSDHRYASPRLRRPKGIEISYPQRDS
jgi:hypothetical protein